MSEASTSGPATSIGRSHELAAELWASGVFEARALAATIDEPDRILNPQHPDPPRPRAST